MNSSLLPVLSAAAFCVVPHPDSVMAQNYPVRPLRMIVPFAPGGGTDIVARVVAQQMTDGLKQQVVIDNRGGAGGLIGTALGVRSQSDGYTLVMIAAGYAMYPALYELDYHPLNDISPIGLVGSSPSIVAAHPAVPARNIQELIAYAKAHPGKLNYGSSGLGGNTHLTTELFNYMAGVAMTHIPYKGNAPAIVDLIGGQIHVMFGSMLSLRPQIRAGKLRGLAVTSLRRSAAVPDLPTVAESGVPGYEAASWYGIIGPAAIPQPIVTRLNDELRRVVALRDIAERLAQEGLEPQHTTPAELARALRDDIAKWARVVKAAKITVK